MLLSKRMSQKARYIHAYNCIRGTCNMRAALNILEEAVAACCKFEDITSEMWF
jgi:hypothetical protein